MSQEGHKRRSDGLCEDNIGYLYDAELVHVLSPDLSSILNILRESVPNLCRQFLDNLLTGFLR